MADSNTYRVIVSAVNRGVLAEPFNEGDFRHACPGLGEGTYKAFLHKHSAENPGDESELFERVAPGSFKLIRPIKYGFGNEGILPNAECHCDQGWICEEHPEKPWPHETCAGPGTRCSNPDCVWWKGAAPAALDTNDWEMYASTRGSRATKKLN